MSARSDEGGARLLTLTGPGGAGKTRLALEVALRVAPAWPDGVAWVELAPIHEASQVPTAIAAALGLVEQPGRDAVAAVADHCAARRLLLVLDNCEHLVEPCAVLVTMLLDRCPALGVLATSREPLGLAGEVTRPVPPLAVPTVEVLREAADAARRTAPRERAGSADAVAAVAASPAVALFVERARAALPAFALTPDNAADVAAVCRRLDGLPLGIELAAARVRALTPRQIAARLDDALRLLRAGRRAVPARQRTLEAAVEWSYALLSEAERALFRRLAVFRGGWTLDAAEQVGTAVERVAGDPLDALDLLARLVDKSLVIAQEADGEARYALLEPIRQYAARCLAEAGEEGAARRTHAAYFVRLAEAAAPARAGPARDAWVPRVLAEHENVRAALGWAAVQAPGSDDASFGARIVAALWPLWAVATRWRDGHAWAVAALPAAAATRADRPLIAAVLVAAGAFGWMLGDPAAVERLEAGTAAAREQADTALVALALAQRGQAAAAHGDREAARAALDEAVAVARAHAGAPAAAGGARWLIGATLTAALLAGGWSGADPADVARALALQHEAEHIWEAEGDRWGLGIVRACASGLACARGDFRTAAAYARASLETLLPEPAPYDVAQVLGALARATALGGDVARAAWLLGAEASLRAQVGAGVLPTQQRTREAVVAAARAALGDEAFARASADGARASLDEVIAWALDAGGDERLSSVPVGTPGAAALMTTVTGTAPVVADAAAPLRIRALGTLAVVRDGRALGSADWGFAKPRELLAYLLCHPRGATKEQIGVALWPEASASQLRGSFHVAVHHLRRALGDPRWVTFAHGRYALARVGPCDIDVEHFEAAVTEARRRRRACGGTMITTEAAQGMHAALAAHAAAVALYSGDLFTGESLGTWADGRRRTLRRAYLDTLLALADLQLDAGTLEGALDTYGRATEEDSLWEAAHRGVIRTLAALGRRADALRHYANVVHLLRDELGARPDAATEALRRDVQQGTVGSYVLPPR